MDKSFLSLMWVMVSFKLLLIILGLIIYLRVPDLASNLLFVHKLCLQNNAFCYFDVEKFSIQDLPSGRILYKGLSKDGVYPIPTASNTFIFSKSSVYAFASIKPDLILLWHHRLGHPSSRISIFYLAKCNKVCVFVSDWYTLLFLYILYKC